jgi:hypothetical protein
MISSRLPAPGRGFDCILLGGPREIEERGNRRDERVLADTADTLGDSRQIQECNECRRMLLSACATDRIAAVDARQLGASRLGHPRTANRTAFLSGFAVELNRQFGHKGRPASKE